MIDYIKYTVNDKSYYLTNNGDGTWSKELNAPDVSGLYNLLLEISENGIKTHIDSSDPRYHLYLNVINEVERRVDLIKYLPNFLQNVSNFKSIFDTENIELDNLYGRIKEIALDAFIRTASIDRITRLETFLGFKGIGTLEQRRLYLLALTKKENKLNEALIKEIVHTITGSDCEIIFWGESEAGNPQPGTSLLQVKVFSPDGEIDYRYADIQRILKPLTPAHVTLVVMKYFATWEDVKSNYASWNTIYAMQDWIELKNYIPPQ